MSISSIVTPYLTVLKFFTNMSFWTWIVVSPVAVLVLYYTVTLSFSIIWNGIPAKEETYGAVTKTEDLRVRLERQSMKFAEYHNNLDQLLGIRTVIVDQLQGPPMKYIPLELSLFPDSLGIVPELHIGTKYDWYITDKYPLENIFIVVGIDSRNRQRKYCLGKWNYPNAKPVLKEIKSSTTDYYYVWNETILESRGHTNEDIT